MKKSIILTLLMALAVVFSGCDGGSSNNKKAKLNSYGNPYSVAGTNLKGRVKSVTRIVYKKNKVSKRETSYYNPEGLITSRVLYSGGKTTETTYTYDSNNKIQDVESPTINNYESNYEGGMLTSETIHNKGGGGYTSKYKFDSEGNLESKTNTDLHTNREYYYKFNLNSDGTPASYTVTYPSGKVMKITYTTNEVTEEVDKNGTGNFKPMATYNLQNDNEGNWVVKRGLTTGDGSYRKYYERRVITYYPSEPKVLSNTSNSDSLVEDESSSDSTAVSSPLVADKNDGNTKEEAAPSSALIIIVILLSLSSLAFYLKRANEKIGLFHNFGGTIQDNGMKRMWMYNPEPYKKMLTIFLIMLGAFLTAIIILLLSGIAVWILFWIVKIIVWAIIVIGYILLIGGIITVFCGGGCYSICSAIIGGIITYFADTLKSWGETAVAWGQQTLDTLNLMEWTASLFTNYGLGILGIIAIPFILFIQLSILLIVVSLILRGIEFAALKIYNINRPCPVCGNKNGFTYVINGIDHPVPLHPGIYGMFHQTNYMYKYRVPTMLFNGKAHLIRQCDNCGSIINAKKQNDLGTELHIGFVGERSSGKSYLLYSALEQLCADPEWKECIQIDADRNNRIEVMTERIHNNDGIQTTVRNRYKAIQLLLRTNSRPVPYHLFFYDVAGEKFNISNIKHTALEFYQNVNTIVYVLDPTMTDLTGASPSEDFVKWQRDNYASTEKYNPESTIASLVQILEHVGKKTKDINLIIVCTKKDLGYLNAVGLSYEPTGDVVREFVNASMGLYNFVNTIEPTFKSVTYVAVSAIDNSKKSLTNFLNIVLKKIGIN